MIAIPIVLLVLLLAGGFAAVVVPGVDDWLEVLFAVAVVVGVFAFAAAIVGLIAWIEAWS